MTTRYENYTLDDGFGFYNSCGEPNRKAQSFMPQESHTITAVRLMVTRATDPPLHTIGVGIHATTPQLSGYTGTMIDTPTAPFLASGSWTGALPWGGVGSIWVDIPLLLPYNLLVGLTYAISFRTLTTFPAQAGWRMNGVGPLYDRGTVFESNDGGLTWFHSIPLGDFDYLFEEWGVPAVVVPTVTTDPATDVVQKLATLNGTLANDGGEACQVRFQYGLTDAYGTNTEWQSGKETGNTFEETISGLEPNTTYHFRAQALNSAGTASGADRTFTTQELLIISKAYALARCEL